MPKQTRFQRMSKKQKAENEHNMVLAEYVMLKYGPIVDDGLKCYAWLKKNWPNNGKPYKRTKNMTGWLRGKINTYIETVEALQQEPQQEQSAEVSLPQPEQPVEVSLPQPEQPIEVPQVPQPEQPVEVPQVPQPEQPVEAVAEDLLAELDARVGEIMRMLENEEDEGIEVGKGAMCTPEYVHLYPEEYDEDFDFDVDFDLGLNIEIPHY